MQGLVRPIERGIYGITEKGERLTIKIGLKDSPTCDACEKVPAARLFPVFECSPMVTLTVCDFCHSHLIEEKDYAKVC